MKYHKIQEHAPLEAPEICIFLFMGSGVGQEKVEIEGVPSPSDLRAEILRRTPVWKLQMVPWRPIWWQKGWLWGPLGFRAQPAHPAGGGR